MKTNGNSYNGFGQQSKKGALKLITADQVTVANHDWIWKHYLARKQIELIAGAPGTGKTTIALDFAATITRGGNWPDGTTSPTGSVLIWSGEDDLNTTIVPRLIACNANLPKIHFIGEVFNPTHDMERLFYSAKNIPDLSMVIFDPIVSTIIGDSHKNAEVRQGMLPLKEFAEHANCLIFGVTHFTKGTAGRAPLERVTGSLAYGAAPRLVMMTAKSKESEGKNYLMRGKSNIGPEGGGFIYELSQKDLVEQGINDAQYITWGEEVSGFSAEEMLNTVEGVPETKSSRYEEAENWIKEKLKNGPVESRAIILELDELRFSKATLDRVKKKLNIISEKTSGEGGWIWRLPVPYKKEQTETIIDGLDLTH